MAKGVAEHGLRSSQPVPLVGEWIRLNLTHNAASAFGLLSCHWLLVAIGGAVCLVILAYIALWRGLRRHPHQAVALGLILGGSLGNLADRLRMRAVIDFIDLRVWPVFNLADIAITVGFVLLAVTLIRR
jgi:signal peptidase II